MRRTLVAFLLCVLGAGCAAQGERAAAPHQPPSPLDGAFGRDGITTAPALGLWSHTFVRLHSGKLVAVGFSRRPRGVAFVRYLASGRVDRSVQRRVFPQLGAGKLDALAAVGQPDDKVVVAACQPPDCRGYVAVARFHPEGHLDGGFGKRGIVRTAIPDGHLTPLAIALQPDGKILVAGQLQRIASSRGNEIFIARYDRAGHLDREFGKSGTVTVGDLTEVGAIVVQPDGHILIGGGSLIARLSPSGDLDATFGARGIANAPRCSLSALLLQPNGTIVAGGSGGNPRKPVFALARFTPNGRPDPSFAFRGRLLHQRPGDHWARVETLLPTPDRKLVAVGWATRGRSVLERRYRFVVLAVTSSGRLDPNFGDRGRVTLWSIQGQARAAFSTARRRVLVVGPDSDLKPKQVFFSQLVLP